MKDQYGSKRGEQVFYASKNKGKIKGVEKKKNGGLGQKSGPPPKKGPASQGIIVKKLSVGGGADMGASAGSPGPGDTGGAGGFDKSTSQFGAKGSSPTSTGGGNATVAKTTTSGNKSFTMPPMGKVGLAITALKEIENTRRQKRAKGEFFLSSKKDILFDFYHVLISI